MRRLLTLLLILITLAYWVMSLCTLAGHLSGKALWCSFIPAALGFLMLLFFFAARRIFSHNDAVRRRFSSFLSATLLIAIACVYADTLLLNGAIFGRILALLRLDIFYDRRLELTLAIGGAYFHPILFILSNALLWMLPTPKDDFFRGMR